MIVFWSMLVPNFLEIVTKPYTETDKHFLLLQWLEDPRTTKYKSLSISLRWAFLFYIHTKTRPAIKGREGLAGTINLQELRTSYKNHTRSHPTT